MNTHQQTGDQGNQPGGTDPARPDQAPNAIPGKETPGHTQPRPGHAPQSVPGKPSQPGQSEPGKMPQPSAGQA